MKKLTVEVCVCTHCVLNGAMNIIESIESLKKLKVQLRMQTQVNIETSPKLIPEDHGDKSPMVKINGNIIENADSETIMAKVISAIR